MRKFKYLLFIIVTFAFFSVFPIKSYALESNNSFVFKINDINGIIELELPRIYYLGYVLEDSEGNNIKLFENKNGFIGVKIDKEGTYYLEYVGTIYKRIAKLIQIITIILVVGSVVVKWIRRKKLQ